MDVTSPETATLGIWTIARFAALAVLATEAVFFYARRREPRHASPSRLAWTLTPALLLAGAGFLACGLAGLRKTAGVKWARREFAASLVYLTVLFGTLMLGR